MYLSVIIPAYNEEKRIAKTLRAVHDYLSRQSYEYEILVVVDGASDNTASVVNGLTEEVAHLRLIDNKENHGKGFVVKQGMLEANGDIRLFTDADNSTAIEHVEKFLPFFKEGFDVVIGSRRVKGAEIAVHQPFYKELAGRIGNLIIRIFAVGGIADTQAGFKAFSAKAAEDVFSVLTIDRWGFDFEALAVAKKFKYRIKEVPIRWVNDEMSHVKLSAYIKTLFEALKVRKNLMIGKYKKDKTQ